ncbi:MAG: HlyC/CorC family transporter [Acidobacteria bacterium]|nr:HlyC/CorC family transporter [Acidobacteriota bacterium]
MEIDLEIVLTCLLLGVLAFLATIDMAFGQLSDVGLRRLIAEREEEPVARMHAILSEMVENRPRFRFTLTAVIQVLQVAIAVLVTSISYRWLGQERRFLLAAFFVGLILSIVFRQIIPRVLSLHNPDAVLRTLLPVYRPFYGLFSFVAIPWHKSFDRLRRTNAPAPEMSAEEEEDDEASDIQALIDVGEEEGILEGEEGELIQSILEFGDTRVNEVMTPRTDIVALPLTATVRQARDTIIESRYSRLPVYREQIDNVEGIIYMRDLLGYWAEGREDETIEPLLRPAFFVPETKPVDELLEEMQKLHVQLALVIDEYGGLAGLVTVEDILEEIVGEIEDEDIEHDEIVEFIEGENGYYDVAGSTDVDKIERLFNLELEDDNDVTTIAGLVISAEGRVPPPGTHLTFHGLDVEVLQSDERRIVRLRLRRSPNGESVETQKL